MGELRSHMPYPPKIKHKQNTKQKQHCNNLMKTLKMVHIKKKKEEQKGRQDLVSNLKRMKKYFASGAEEPKEKKRRPANVA